MGDLARKTRTSELEHLAWRSRFGGPGQPLVTLAAVRRCFGYRRLCWLLVRKGRAPSALGRDTPPAFITNFTNISRGQCGKTLQGSYIAARCPSSARAPILHTWGPSVRLGRLPALAGAW